METSIDSVDLDSLCRSIIDAATQFYSDPEHVKEFEAWKAKQKEANLC